MIITTSKMKRHKHSPQRHLLLIFGCCQRDVYTNKIAHVYVNLISAHRLSTEAMILRLCRILALRIFPYRYQMDLCQIGEFNQQAKNLRSSFIIIALIYTDFAIAPRQVATLYQENV